jgi:hypothetical protein
VLIEPGKWRLSNWSCVHTFEPRSIYAPATLDELLAVVEQRGRSGRKLKPAASLHSWSACAVTDDVSLQMGCLFVDVPYGPDLDEAANIFSNPFSDRICGSTHHKSV